MTLNELAAEIHQNSQEKGFWKGSTCLNRYCQANTPRHPADAILLISSECVEAYEAIRDGHALNAEATDWISGPNMRNHQLAVLGDSTNRTVWVTHLDGGPVMPPVELTDDIRRKIGFEAKPVGVPSELADIIIRTLDTAAAWGIDIDAAVQTKMAYNRTRPHMHGRKG